MNEFLLVIPTMPVASLNFPRKCFESCRSLAVAILAACEKHIRKVNHLRHLAHHWLAAVHGGTRNEILVTWVSRSTCSVQCTEVRIFSLIV